MYGIFDGASCIDGVIEALVVQCECWIDINVNIIIFDIVVSEVNIELYCVTWDLSIIVQFSRAQLDDSALKHR